VNSPFKKRIIKASIIPHSSAPAKSIKIFAVLIPIIIIVMLSISVYLTVLTMLNFRNLKKFSSVKKTKNDITLLSMKDEELGKKINVIETNIDSMKMIAKNISPVYKFLSGINIEKNDEKFLPNSPDSLLSITEYLKTVTDSTLKKLSSSGYASKVPSVIPVNGWILRDYGTVFDPYTEQEKFSPGIVFVSENEEKVYSTADGYVS